MRRPIALSPWLLLVGIAAVSPAFGDCWIDREHATTADGLPIGSPRIAEQRAIAHAINESLEANAGLRSLPDVRWRSSWQVTGHPDATGDPYGVHLVLWAHGPQSWAGECDLIAEADRLEPLAAVVVQTNSANSTLAQLGSSVRDDTLHAFAEPDEIGRVGGYPLYRGQWIVLTLDGRVPWVPVTMDEYLAFEERRLVDAETEIAGNIADAAGAAESFDDASMREAYEAMREVDPTQAEALLEIMRNARAELERAIASAPPIANAATASLAELRAFRAALSPAELAAQARDGYVSRTPPVPIDRLRKLVKLDPSLTRGADANRVLLMEIHFSGRGEPYDRLMRQAAETFDWPLLESLMRR